MAELMAFNPFESFNRGRQQAAQNALMADEMALRQDRPELIRNALETGNTQDLFARDPQVGMQVQNYIGALNEREREAWKQKHEASLKELAFVQSLPEDQRPMAYAQIAPRVNQRWGQEVLPPQYDPMAVGSLVAQGMEISDILAKSGSGPASVQEYQFFDQLSPEEKKRFMSLKRADQIVDIAGVPHVRTPQGFVPLSTPEAEIGAVVDEASAKTLATERARNQAEEEANAPKLKMRAQQQIAAIDNTFEAIDKALKEVDWSTAGPIGSTAARVPGTDAYNLAQTVLTIKANIGFDRLQQMRESSPTGGALGQVSNQELDALQATIASLDQSQTPGQLRANLKKIREHYQKWKDTIQKWKVSKASEQPQEADPLGIRY